MIKNIKYVIIIVCLITGVSLNAQNKLIYLKKVSNSELEILDHDNSIKGHITLSNSILKDVSISPKGNYISLIEEPKDFKVSTKNKFKLLSENGEIVDSINEDVRKYDWGNKSNNIALLTGSYREGGIGFIPEKLIIYNQDKKSKIIVNGKFKELGAYELAWSPDDSKLYIKTLRNFEIYEYDVKKKSLNLTNYKDIYFSPDGKYYYQKYRHIYKREFAIYDAKTNEKIFTNTFLSNYDNRNKTIYGELVGWSQNDDHVLLFKKVDEDIEYEDFVVQEKSKDKDKIVLRKFTKREVVGINYNYIDIKSGALIEEFRTNGAEHNIIKRKKDFLYMTNGKLKSRSVKIDHGSR